MKVLDSNIFIDLLSNVDIDCSGAFVPYAVVQESLTTLAYYNKHFTKARFGKYTIKDAMRYAGALHGSLLRVAETHKLNIENFDAVGKALAVCAETGLDYVDAWLSCNYMYDDVLTRDKRLKSMLRTALSEKLVTDVAGAGFNCSSQVAARIIHLYHITGEQAYYTHLPELIQACVKYDGG